MNTSGARLLAINIIARAVEDYLALRRGCAKGFRVVGPLRPEKRSDGWPKTINEAKECCAFFRDGRLDLWLELADLGPIGGRICEAVEKLTLAGWRAKTAGQIENLPTLLRPTAAETQETKTN